MRSFGTPHPPRNSQTSLWQGGLISRRLPHWGAKPPPWFAHSSSARSQASLILLAARTCSGPGAGVAALLYPRLTLAVGLPLPAGDPESGLVFGAAAFEARGREEGPLDGASPANIGDRGRPLYGPGFRSRTAPFLNGGGCTRMLQGTERGPPELEAAPPGLEGLVPA